MGALAGGSWDRQRKSRVLKDQAGVDGRTWTQRRADQTLKRAGPKPQCQWRREGAARAMRPSLGAGKSGEGGTVNSGEETAMAIPSQKVGSGTNQETEHCLDSFLGVLEYLSEATGLSIEDIADLLSSEEGPVGAMVLAGHLQATTKPQTD